MNSETRNLVLFIVVAMIIFEAYSYFVMKPAEQRAQAKQAAAEASVKANLPPEPAKVAISRTAALAQTPRVTFDTRPAGGAKRGSPSVYGTISLRGARIDDLFLAGYGQTADKESAPVELLAPEGTAHPYFVDLGWTGANLAGMPTPDTVWTLSKGDVLRPGRPVVLTYSSPGGLAFTRTIAVDDKSMFTITDQVANLGAQTATVAAYGSVQRQGLPELAKSGIVHEGAIGILDGQLRQRSYRDLKKKPDDPVEGAHGWVGITEKYWMTSLIPAASERIAPRYRMVADPSGTEIYETNYTAAPKTIPAGRQISETVRVFAGAKTVPVLKAYKQQGVERFDDAVDWGHLWFLTKPAFFLLELFHGWVGNFGIAILMLTVVVRLITFPIMNNSFEMSTKLKKVQPQMKALQDRFKEDPKQLQSEMMALYQREKVNPVAGCLPILLQFPILYALVKLFTVTIEMRHAPFFGWIQDLSAPDPTSIWNLFGAIPWDVKHSAVVLWLEHLPFAGGIFLGIFALGAWPIVYGFTMWLSQSMTPMTGMDPTQQALMKWMPVVFTFILSQYAVGLLIYWSWSSLITIIQQYLIMHRLEVENPIDGAIDRLRGRRKEPAASG
jgi:YidC/Oxa1 family membrane protein insertase